MGGDFSFKVDIHGLTPRDYTALAREMAAALGKASSSWMKAGLIRFPASSASWRGGPAWLIDDAGPDGFGFARAPPLPERRTAVAQCLPASPFAGPA